MGLIQVTWHSSLQGWLSLAGFWARTINSLIAWFSEHCSAHGRQSTTPEPVCPGVVARNPPGGTGTVSTQRNQAGLVGCVGSIGV